MKEEIRFAWALRNLGRTIKRNLILDLGIARLVEWLSKVIK